MRARPREQFVEGERLGQRCVRAEIQGPHDVVTCVAGRQREHRRFDLILAQDVQHVEAVTRRQRRVEDQEIERGVVGQAIERALAVESHLGRVALFLEPPADDARQSLLGHGDQHTHGDASSPA